MSKDQRRMERFIVIPFSSTCRSDSSVDVIDSRQAKKSQGGDEGAAGCAGRPKGESLLARLLKGFKNLSQIFAAYEDEEEEEREMVIGLPTDVKHVAHIGWDGSTNTTSSVRSWNRAAPPPPPSSASPSTSSSTAAPTPQQQQAPLPAFSMQQFELAMAAQAAAGVGTATAASTSTASTTARQYHRHS